MAKVKVKTSFNTILTFDSGIHGKRILAYFIDLAIIILYIILSIWVSSMFDLRIYELEDGDRISWGITSLLSIPVVFYTLISEMLSGGYTIGKYAVRIKVVKLDGFQPSFVEFFIRWIFRLVDIYFVLLIAILISNYFVLFLSVYVTGLVGFIFIVRSENSQRIGDKVAGTVVIRSKQKQSINITILQDLKDNYVPVFKQVIRFSDNDARIIKETYQNAIRHRDAELMKKLVIKIEGIMDVKSEMRPRKFVETVLKDFNYYTQKM